MIAQEYHVSVRALAKANDLDPTDHVRRGRRLVIPERPRRVAVKPSMHHDSRTKGDRVSLRRGPGESYGRVAFVDDGAPLTVTAHRHGWFQVELDSGGAGWISADYIAHAERLAHYQESAASAKPHRRHSRHGDPGTLARHVGMAHNVAATKAMKHTGALRQQAVAVVPARHAADSEPGEGRHRSMQTADRALAARVAGMAARSAIASIDHHHSHDVAMQAAPHSLHLREPHHAASKQARRHKLEVAFNLSQRATDIVRTAYAYRGTPYVYGGASRGGFDCSGFTSYLYARQGIALPHSAREQFQMGRHVSKADLKPGDLVFFHTVTPGISHVGMYVGNGRFVHASSRRSGGVRVDSLDSGYYSSAYRGATRLR